MALEGDFVFTEMLTLKEKKKKKEERKKEKKGSAGRKKKNPFIYPHIQELYFGRKR